MKHHGVRLILGMTGCVLAIIGCIVLEGLQQEDVPVLQAVETDNTQAHHAYGLEEGAQLSKIKLVENDAVVCYEDRAFYRFRVEEEMVTNVSVVATHLLERCPELEQMYIFPVPSCVLTEEGYEADYDSYQDHLESLQRQMSQKVKVLDAAERLMEHKEEYIFFRSEDAWTPRGAYYGAQIFLEETEREAVPLEQYTEDTGQLFVGNMRFHDAIEGLSQAKETAFQNPLYYYRLEQYPQQVEIIQMEADGTKTSYKKPLFTPSSKNLTSILEQQYDRAIVRGQSMDGKKEDKYLMVICDQAGMLLVPYLKDYYAGVYVINIHEDAFLYHDISDLVKAYNITEVVWAQTAMKLGKTGYYRALVEFNQQ